MRRIASRLDARSLEFRADRDHSLRLAFFERRPPRFTGS